MALNGRDMDAHMALAVSYTNEMYRDEALSSLGARTYTHIE